LASEAHEASIAAGYLCTLKYSVTRILD